MADSYMTASLQRNTPISFHRAPIAAGGFPVSSRLLYSPAKVHSSEATTMHLYDSLGPNPRATRMFLLEKGITIPTKTVDLLGAENRKPPYTDRNPGGQIPALELDKYLDKLRAEAIIEWKNADIKKAYEEGLKKAKVQSPAQ